MNLSTMHRAVASGQDLGKGGSRVCNKTRAGSDRRCVEFPFFYLIRHNDGSFTCDRQGL